MIFRPSCLCFLIDQPLSLSAITINAVSGPEPRASIAQHGEPVTSYLEERTEYGMYLDSLGPRSLAVQERSAMPSLDIRP